MPTYFDSLPMELNLMIWKKVHQYYMADIKIELEMHHIWHSNDGNPDCPRCGNTGARCSDCSKHSWILDVDEDDFEEENWALLSNPMYIF
jgi:predicted RNA-binding Zn-ribbon protein involved in translation (DUF1610 family)